MSRSGFKGCMFHPCDSAREDTVMSPTQELKKPEVSQADGTLTATLQHIINKSYKHS